MKTTLQPGERLFTEPRTTTFRKETFTYIHTGIVDAEGEVWTTTELDTANINQVWNQYRVKHGIPFPDEIRSLRGYYGLSAAKMAEILGFGVNQYRYYEDGEVPSVSNARILIAIRDKRNFLEFLSASRNSLGEKEYCKLLGRVSMLGEFAKPSVLPSVETGFVSYSIEKTRALVCLLIGKMGGIFVTKMNKLLFYADFLMYRSTGFGITGLRYRAMQFGPVPENWGSVYDSLHGVSMNECVFADRSGGVKLETDEIPDIHVLTDAEIAVADEVCALFKDMNVAGISEKSHQERGWIENHAAKGVISYDYAFDLSL